MACDCTVRSQASGAFWKDSPSSFPKASSSVTADEKLSAAAEWDAACQEDRRRSGERILILLAIAEVAVASSTHRAILRRVLPRRAQSVEAQ
jgi:hypothetical protein